MFFERLLEFTRTNTQSYESTQIMTLNRSLEIFNERKIKIKKSLEELVKVSNKSEEYKVKNKNEVAAFVPWRQTPKSEVVVWTNEYGRGLPEV